MIVAPFPAARIKKKVRRCNSVKENQKAGKEIGTKVNEITARTCVTTVNEFPVLSGMTDAESKRIAAVYHRDRKEFAHSKAFSECVAKRCGPLRSLRETVNNQTINNQTISNQREGERNKRDQRFGID